MDKDNTAQILVTRAETAERKLELAIEQIERSAQNLIHIKQMIRIVVGESLSLSVVGKLDLIGELIESESNFLTTWDIPF